MVTSNGLAQVKALIRFYFKEEPDAFDDIAKSWGQLKFALQFEGKMKMIEVRRG